MKIIILSFLIISIFTANSNAKIIGPSLNQLIRHSDKIVLVTVLKVDTTHSKKRFAVARVDSNLTGNSISTICYRAYPTLTCDITDAKKGERALLFLSSKQYTNKVELIWAGRGRMPIEIRNGVPYVTLFEDILFPYNIMKNVIRDTVKEKSSIYIQQYAPLSVVILSIYEMLKNPAQPIWDIFIPPNMYQIDSYVNRHSNVSQLDLKMLFDGTAVSGGSEYMLNFMLGNPQSISNFEGFECWHYHFGRRKGDFKIVNHYVVEDSCHCSKK